MDYPPPLPRSKPFRPALVTAVGIIGILFASMGILCSPFALIPYFMELGGPNPVVDHVKQTTWMYVYMIVSLAIGFVMAWVLLAGSIGALRLKPWARPTLMGYAAVSLVLTVVGAVASLAMFLPLTNQMDNPAMMGGVIGGLFGAVFSICFGFALQGGLLYVMTRPEVKRAFEAS